MGEKTRADQKRSVLYLQKILREETDAQHPLTAEELLQHLDAYGIDAGCKNIYDSIKALQESGIDIRRRDKAPKGYYLATRPLELPELKLLVDAVQVSRFITEESSRQLIKKLEHFTNSNEAGALQRQVYVGNRLKTENEDIFRNINEIHAALSQNSKVSFQYLEWTVLKKLIPKHDGQLYTVSPLTLTWADENYYLIAYAPEHKGIRHYRVDKMKGLRATGEKRDEALCCKTFDVASYNNMTFGMYGGRPETVTLSCANQLAGPIIDRFGTDTMMIPKGAEHFHAIVHVNVSPQFYGWIFGLGAGVKIVGPADVRDEYKEFLRENLENYL
ncbi:MAG TPA: WYL domain-containing protein [Lachnospiraceae bacterium]|nr:WYL domain-containing protein [Lachnospiraceae bacterium]